MNLEKNEIIKNKTSVRKVMAAFKSRIKEQKAFEKGTYVDHMCISEWIESPFKITRGWGNN